ncbi:hypothetical protein ACFPT7_23940 [Acidicapsa dinghuensis]|uniref:Uncharacterized protein n=1 Tax=Acidicapsa dinghuensis TaxID=2218256 RepID=A0ABW1EQ07_9BACT|nr:hypothetical protein [Acidicapsa dinghuensis]
MFKELADCQRMVLWRENFAIPVVLNEPMLQNYSGTIPLLPNDLNLVSVCWPDMEENL